MAAEVNYQQGSLSSDEDGDDFDEEADDDFAAAGVTQDLFSNATFPDPRACLANAKKTHGVDFKKIVCDNKMDCFDFFKLVNFIRENGTKAGDVESIVKSNKAWKDEKYLRPALPDDPLLQLGMDIDDGCFMNDAVDNDVDDDMPALEEDGMEVSKDPSDFEAMKRAMEQLREELQRKDEAIAQLMRDVGVMRNTAQALVDGAPERRRTSSGTGEGTVSRRDESYAGSYAHFGIHHEMLSDRVRTESYRDAIQHADSPVAGARVLDLGCGTGILSMFSARSGASSVVGVDMSDIVHQAMDIVRENGLEDRVRLVKGRLEDVHELDGEKFDVIVSEWMGYFLLYEGMLDSVIAARKRYLAPGGRVLPNRCTMHLVAVSDLRRYDETVTFWSDVYGFKMSCMRQPSLVEASVEVAPRESVVSPAALIRDLDMEKCEVADTEFEAGFELTIERDCEVTAVAGYFDTFFDLRNGSQVTFTTGPHGTATHWKQTIFYLKEKVKAVHGQVIRGKILVRRPHEDARSLRVRLTLDGKEQEYTVE